MTNQYFSVPYIECLQKIDGWERDPKNSNKYSVIRCHYLLKGPYQTTTSGQFVKKGEIIGAAVPYEGVKQKFTQKWEYEFSEIEAVESVKESLQEDISIRKFVSSLSSSIGINLVKIVPSVLYESSQTLRNTFRNQFALKTTEVKRVKKETTWECEITPGKFENCSTLIATKGYTQVEYRLYLQFIDYLIIEYSRPPRGIKLRRNKIPPASSVRPMNIISLNLPLASLLLWKEIPDWLMLSNEKDYKVEVIDPTQVIISELDDNTKYPKDSYPPKPSLYSISENVFPRKKWSTA